MENLGKAQDDLATIGHLVETIYMAANDIDQMQQTNALQAVCEVIHGKIATLKGDLATIHTAARKGGDA